MGSSLWDRILIVAACAIAGCLLVFAAKRELFDNKPASSGVSQSVQALPTGETPESSVAGAQRTPRSISTPVRAKQVRVARATPTTRPDRQDCDALRGVHDRTRSERQWFIDNCMFLSKKQPAKSKPWTAQLQAAGFSLGDQPAPRRSALEADTTPPPTLTRQVAIGEATHWITNDSPVSLSIESDGCNAVWLNGHWVVTCSVRLAGCQGESCVASLSLCVFATDPAIVPDQLC